MNCRTFGGPLSGFRIAVSQYLVGGKRAVRIGDTIHVSPAMYDLMKHAEGDELERLLRAIELAELPAMMFDLPMATEKPR